VIGDFPYVTLGGPAGITSSGRGCSVSALAWRAFASVVTRGWRESAREVATKRTCFGCGNFACLFCRGKCYFGYFGHWKL
jgi:hypothetical protein